MLRAFSRHPRRKDRVQGRLWRDRFRHEPVMPDLLLSIGQQLERLPVQAGLTKHPADYPYSSYAHYALGHPNRYLDPHPLISGLSHHRLSLAGTVRRPPAGKPMSTKYFFAADSADPRFSHSPLRTWVVLVGEAL